MKVVIQRVEKASVEVEKKTIGKINRGLLLLVGVEEQDTMEDVVWMAKKAINLRVFADHLQPMNLSVKDVAGGILVISQFTLYASTKKGNRPSFTRAAKPELALELFECFKTELSKLYGSKVQSGIFGADMKVQLINDGPVTIIIDSKNKE